MEMKVSVIDVSANQKKLQVEIPAQKVQEELNKRYGDLAKRVNIKGFRPGKVPRKILKSYYGKSIEGEVSNQFIQETFPEALRESELKPLAEADVNEMHFDDGGSFTYEAILEVCPPFEVKEYKGLEIQKPPVRVTEDQVETELQNLREHHAQLRTLEAERPVQNGDIVVIDFTPWVEGAIFEKGKAADYMMEIGKKTVHENFDEHLVGHRLNETFSFELDYSEDVPTKEVAGKRVRFDVTVREIKEKILPELDDDFAQEAGQQESLDALKEEIRKQLREQEEKRVEAEVRQQIRDKLLDKIDLELSPKAIEREVDYFVGQLQHQFQSQGLKVDTSKFDTPQIRAGYRPEAEKSLRWRLILDQIAVQENIKLSEEETEEIYNEVARLLRKDVETVKRDYADSTVVEQVREGKIQEKVLKLIEEAASYTTPSENTENSD